MHSEIIAVSYVAAGTWVGTFVVREFTGKSTLASFGLALAAQGIATVFALYLVPLAAYDLLRSPRLTDAVRLTALMSGLPSSLCLWLILHFSLKLDATGKLFARVWIWQMCALGLFAVFLVGFYMMIALIRLL